MPTMRSWQIPIAIGKVNQTNLCGVHDSRIFMAQILP